MNQHSDVKRASATPAPQPLHRCPTCGKPKGDVKVPVIRMVIENGRRVEKVGGIRI